MGMSGAEKQRRYRERHQVILTDTAESIAAMLMGMEDQKARAPPGGAPSGRLTTPGVGHFDYSRP
jgi:hypothetical protein